MRKTRVEFKVKLGNIGFSHNKIVAKKSSTIHSDVEAPKEMPMSCCVCDPMETSQSWQ